MNRLKHKDHPTTSKTQLPAAVSKTSAKTSPKHSSLNFVENPLIIYCTDVFDRVLTLLNSTSQQSEDNTVLTAELFENVYDEIKRFQSNLQQLNYPSVVIVAARYLVACFVQEALSLQSNAKQYHAQIQQLLPEDHHSSLGGERFFAIIERCYQNPQENIELLELAYWCLQLGFTGRLQQHNHYHQSIIQLSERLYYTIRDIRGGFKQQLFIDASPSLNHQIIQKAPENHSKQSRWFKLLTPVIVASIVIVGLAGAFTYYLKQDATVVIAKYHLNENQTP